MLVKVDGTQYGRGAKNCVDQISGDAVRVMLSVSLPSRNAMMPCLSAALTPQAAAVSLARSTTALARHT